MRTIGGPAERKYEEMEVDPVVPEMAADSNDSRSEFARFYFAQNDDSLDGNALQQSRSQSPALTFEDVIKMRLNPKPIELNAQAARKKSAGPFTQLELEALAKEIAEYSDPSKRQAQILVATLSNRATQLECSLLKFDVEYPHQCYKTCLDIILPLYKSNPKSPQIIERVRKIGDALLSQNKRKAHEVVSTSRPDELAGMLIAVASDRFSSVPEEAQFLIYAAIVLLSTSGFQPFGKKVLEAYSVATQNATIGHEGTTSVDVIMLYIMATINESNTGGIEVEELGKLLKRLSHCCFTDCCNPLPKTFYEWITSRFGWKTPVSQMYGLCNQLLAFMIKTISPEKEELCANPHNDDFCFKVSIWLRERQDKLPANIASSIWEHIFKYSIAQVQWFKGGIDCLICWNPPNTASQFMIYTDWLQLNDQYAKRSFDIGALQRICSKSKANNFLIIMSFLQQVELGNDEWITNLTNIGIKHCRSLMVQALILLGKHAEANKLAAQCLKESIEGEEIEMQVFQMQLLVLTNNFVRSIEFGLALLEIPTFRKLTEPLHLAEANESMVVVAKNAVFDYVLTLVGYSLWRIATKTADALVSELMVTSFVLFGQFAWHNNGFHWISELVEFNKAQDETTCKADLTEHVTYPFIVQTLMKLRNAKIDAAAAVKNGSKQKDRPFTSQQKFAKYFFENLPKFERFEELTPELSSRKSVAQPTQKPDDLQLKFELNFE